MRETYRHRLRTRMAKTVLVTGATGFIGRHLVAALCAGGDHVVALSRDVRSARSLLGPKVRVIASLDEVMRDERIDACVHLAGARVLGIPWTDSRRQALINSRTELTLSLIEMMTRLKRRPDVFVCASAVGWYGKTGNASCNPCDETSPPQPGQFQSDLCNAIEHQASRAESFGMRTVRLRFGVVLGHGGGMWPVQANMARRGLLAVLGSGGQFFPWIHVIDAVGLTRLAIEDSNIAGPINVVAPEACSQGNFVRQLAHVFDRRVWLRVPEMPLRLVFGEMADLLLDGQHVLPVAAMRTGYRFVFPTVKSAFDNLAGVGSQD